ncbi:hypothetical protein [Shinella zoogloeoides]|uniref:hypothetical protein n=1 Tax=Shinella zoogloeoides TaxID=352475 RepID=UPI001F59F9A1|nr:hypothetical protein [Shinella zoogloeoides]
MAAVSHKTCKLEIRLDERGKLTPYWDGVRMTGVLRIEIDGGPGHSGEARIVFPTRCFTLATESLEGDG